MDAVERAIRNALENGDAQDAAFRERVYRSAFAALERSLAARADLAPEAANRQRGNLQARITDIESEFIPATEPPARDGEEEHGAPPSAPEPERDAPPEPERARPREPEQRLKPEAAPEPEPAPTRSAPEPEHPAAADFVPRVERDDRPEPHEQDTQDEVVVSDSDRPQHVDRRRPRRAFAWMFLAATLLAAVGIGVWWTIDSGILLPVEERDGAVPNPPLVQEEEDFEPDATEPPPLSSDPVRPASDWMTIFTPSDPTTVSAPAGTTAEIMTGDDETFLRLTARSSEAAVGFDVVRGVLEQLAGASAVFSFHLRAEEGSETQISVSCDFGALGDCGRRRYVVGFAPAEYLLEVELPEAGSVSDGTIRIVPDIAGSGGALDIFGIRVARAE